VPKCKNCSQNFIIEKEDFDFYEKMKALAPSYCWECRMQRRLVHRNERTLHKRTCSKTGKSIISLYPENTPWPVYDAKVWWGDDWDGKDFGMDYDPSRPFFDQWIELRNRVPRINLLVINSVNSDYTNNAEDNKNCYLIFAAQQNEDSLYGRLIYRNKNVMDVAFVADSELCYEGIDLRQCFRVMFSESCETSSDLLFCFDCRDCQNCIFSTNLRHKQYHIYNQPVPKEEYEIKKKQILTSYTELVKAKQEFAELKNKAMVKYSHQVKCHNAVGDYLFNCHDVWYGFDSENAKNCKYIADAEATIDCYDMNNTYYKPELNLDIMGSLQSNNIKHSTYLMYCNDVEYSDSLHNCNQCFGCAGLKKSSYCILNKPYEKEEYERIKVLIIENMKKEGVYGDFLPPTASPFGYNESLANEYWPMKKEEALVKNFRWQDAASGQFGKETIPVANMPEIIDEVQDSILNEILVDETTGQNFRITAAELAFYRRMGIPLPRRSFETRHQDRMRKRNPRKLWKRTTQDGKEVMTAYAPDRAEKILSEEAYQNAVE